MKQVKIILSSIFLGYITQLAFFLLGTTFFLGLNLETVIDILFMGNEYSIQLFIPSVFVWFVILEISFISIELYKANKDD